MALHLNSIERVPTGIWNRIIWLVIVVAVMTPIPLALTRCHV